MSVMRLMTGLFILLAAWVGTTVPALASCEHFAPFGQPIYRSLADQADMLPAPEWSVICHAGQIVAFNPEHTVSAGHPCYNAFMSCIPQNPPICPVPDVPSIASAPPDASTNRSASGRARSRTVARPAHPRTAR